MDAKIIHHYPAQLAFKVLHLTSDDEAHVRMRHYQDLGNTEVFQAIGLLGCTSFFRSKRLPAVNLLSSERMLLRVERQTFNFGGQCDDGISLLARHTHSRLSLLVSSY